MSGLEAMLMSGIDNDYKTDIVKCPFPYLGGKQKSLKHILPAMPVRKVWVEVFGGTGVVSWNRQLSHLNVINDRYSAITQFYKCLRDPNLLREMVDWLKLAPKSREEWEACAAGWKEAETEVTRAAMWYYMMESSVIGKGTSWGRRTNARSIPTLPGRFENFYSIHDKIKKFQIENLDWRKCLEDYDSPDTVFYLDPPYYMTDQGAYKHRMSPEEHKELLERVFDLEGFVALSGFHSDLYDKQPWTEIHEWEIHDKTVVTAYTSTNNRKGHEHLDQSGKHFEVLFIKE